MNFFVNILWIFSYLNYISKIGFMTQHYVLENFHAPFKFLLPQSQALIMTSPLILASTNFKPNRGNANDSEEQWLHRRTDFHFGATFTSEVGLS